MIVVTGGSGFIGSALLAALRHAGIPAKGTSRHPDTRRGALVAVGTIDGQTDWHEVLEGVRVVVHLAARVHVLPARSSDDLSQYRLTNVAGTARLAEQAAASGAERFVFVSSIKVNGETTDGAPFSETDAARPADPYAVSKYEAEQALKAIAARIGLETVMVRPPLVYGPGVKANFLRLMRAVDRGIPLPLARVDNRRSLIGISNLVDFLIQCATRPEAAGETFLISDGEDISTPALIRRLARALGRAPRLWPMPVGVLAAGARMLGQRGAFESLCGSLQIDIRRAREVLGWHPVKSLEDELGETVRWYRDLTRS